MSEKPPKRNLKDVKHPEAESVIDKVIEAFNLSALRIGRSNALSANHRTTLETYRAEMLNKSDMLTTHFPGSPFIQSRDKGSAFIMYAGYWMGQTRELLRLWEQEMKFKKAAWTSVQNAAAVVNAVSILGLDGIDVYFNEKRQAYSVRKH